MLVRGGDTTRYDVPANVEYPSATALDGDLLLGLTRGYAVVPLDSGRVGRPRRRPAATAAVRPQGRGVTVHLTAPDFARAPRWRVRLLGVDTAFSPWTEQASYDYPLLPGGDYRLRWERERGGGGEVAWAVAPRWYETPWAFLAYGVCLALAYLGLRRYYHRRLLRQERLANIQRERELHTERLRRRTEVLEGEVERSRLAAELAAAEAEERRREAEVQQGEVERRNRELAQTTLTLARQKEALLRLKEGLGPLPKSGPVGKARRQLAALIEEQLGGEEDWAFFEEHFDAVHAGFLQRLREAHPTLTSGDLRLAALLRMNLASKEIAPLLHISLRGIENKRYRLRKKMGLGAEVNLADWILRF